MRELRNWEISAIIKLGDLGLKNADFLYNADHRIVKLYQSWNIVTGALLMELGKELSLRCSAIKQSYGTIYFQRIAPANCARDRIIHSIHSSVKLSSGLSTIAWVSVSACTLCAQALGSWAINPQVL